MINDQLFFSYQMRLEAQRKANDSDESDEDQDKMINRMGMSIAASSKFGGGSAQAPSVSNAGSRAVGGAKSSTAPINNIHIRGQFGTAATPIDIAEDLGNETWNSAL